MICAEERAECPSDLGKKNDWASFGLKRKGPLTSRSSYTWKRAVLWPPSESNNVQFLPPFPVLLFLPSLCYICLLRRQSGAEDRASCSPSRHPRLRRSWGCWSLPAWLLSVLQLWRSWGKRRGVYFNKNKHGQTLNLTEKCHILRVHFTTELDSMPWFTNKECEKGNTNC